MFRPIEAILLFVPLLIYLFIRPNFYNSFSWRYLFIRPNSNNSYSWRYLFIRPTLIIRTPGDIFSFVPALKNNFYLSVFVALEIYFSLSQLLSFFLLNTTCSASQLLFFICPIFVPPEDIFHLSYFLSQINSIFSFPDWIYLSAR